MAIVLMKKGFVSTVQDLGRHGFQRFGIIVGGVMDPPSAKLANWLVGNPSDAAVIEFSFIGPAILFEKDTLFALAGADGHPQINGSSVRSGRPLLGKKGQVLTLGGLEHGCRGYLAIAGGIVTPPWFGSQSTDTRAVMGGFHGRSLQEKDEIETGSLTGVQKRIMEHLKSSDHKLLWYFTHWQAYEGRQTIRVMPDQHWPLFKESGRRAFLTSDYQTTPSSDRMGYRLKGQKIELEHPFNLFSEAVTRGSIQVPPNGQPIILMADHQSTGGYPRIGQVAAVDLPVLGQLPPGSRLRFKKITIEEAEQLFLSDARQWVGLHKRVQKKLVELTH